MSIELSYFFNQTITIMCLFLAGLVFTGALLSPLSGEQENVVNKKLLWALALAYPAGLSLFGVCGFLLLVAGIPYNAFSAATAPLFVIAGTLIWRQKKFEKLYDGQKYTIAAVVLFFIILSITVCSGFLRISVSNDSYYYYSVYPQTIAWAGKYLTAFDVFLTDVGQTTAIINTLPWFYGFEETYGIQIILGFDLLLIFCMTAFESSFGITHNKSRALKTALLATLFLSTCTPFLVMTRWILANAYFMAIMFIMFALIIKVSMSGFEDTAGEWVLIALFSAMLSMMRMEGGMITGFLALCACSIKELKNKDLLLYVTLPVAVTQVLYYATVYIKLSVNPLYSFLDYKNAFIMLSFVAAIGVYIAFVRGRGIGIADSCYSYLLVVALIGGNCLLAVITPERYLGNLKFFILNIYLKNGWGYFGMEAAAFVPLIVAGLGLLLIKEKADATAMLRAGIPFPLLVAIGDVLFTLAVCWARDGSLRVGIGDSGNRVLMQIIPFAVFAVSDILTRLTGVEKTGE